MDKVGGEASERQRSKLEWDRQRKESDEKLYSLTRAVIYIRLLIYVEIYLFYFYFTYFLKRSKRVTFNALLLLLRLASPI